MRQSLRNPVSFVVCQTVDAKSFGDGLINGVPGIECTRRILENELHPAPIRLQRFGGVVEWLTVNDDRALSRALGSQQGPSERRLAATAGSKQSISTDI